MIASLRAADGEQLRPARQNVQHTVRRHWPTLNRLVDADRADQVHLLAVRENVDVAVVVAEVHLAVHPVRRAPHHRLEIVLPVFRARLRIQTIQIASLLWNIHQSVVDGGGADRLVEDQRTPALGPRIDLAAVMPHEGGVLVRRRFRIVVVLCRRDIAFLGDIDAPEVPDALAVAGLRRRPDADVHPVAVDDRSRYEIIALLLVLSLGDRAAQELPDHVARLRLQAIEIAIAAGEDHLSLAIDLSPRGIAPLPVDDILAGQVVLPLEFAVLLVQGDDARRLPDGHVPIVVHAVRGDDVEGVADQQRCAGVDDAGVNLQLLHHIVTPQRLAVLDVGADDDAGGSDEIEAAVLDGGSGTQAILLGLIVHRWTGHVVGCLPEELAVFLGEAEQDGLEALDLLVARGLVVGADEDAAVGDDGRDVAAAADGGGPFDVLDLAVLDVPVGSDVLVGEVDEVAALGARRRPHAALIPRMDKDSAGGQQTHRHQAAPPRTRSHQIYSLQISRWRVSAISANP